MRRTIEQIDQRESGNTFTPAHGCAAHQAYDIWIATRQVPEETQAGNLQLAGAGVEWWRGIDQIQLPVLRQQLFPEVFLGFPEREQQERGATQVKLLGYRQVRLRQPWTARFGKAAEEAPVQCANIVEISRRRTLIVHFYPPVRRFSRPFF